MDRPELLKSLVLPLAGGAVVLLGLHFAFPLDGFWMNLSASLITILLTVLFVDRVLQRHDRLRWARVAELLSERVLFTSFSTITGLRRSLGLEPMSPFEGPLETAHTRYVTYCREKLEPAVGTVLMSLDPPGWERLAASIQASYGNLDNLLTLFGPSLDPTELQAVMRAQDYLRRAQMAYQTWPDLLGYKDQDLPGQRQDLADLRDHSVARTGEEIRAVMRECRSLAEHVLQKGAGSTV